MNKQQAKDILKKNTRYAAFDIERIVDDFWCLYGEQEELEFDVSSELEGVYENFDEFAKEFYEDVDEENSQEYNEEYVSELKEFYVFCQNSGAVFKKQ